MIIVDTELSGLDPAKHSIVSIGAYDFGDPSRSFYAECRIWDGAHIMDESLQVNGFSRAQITDPRKPTDREAVERFLLWALDSKEHTIAGQNPSIDRDFIRLTCERYHLNWPLAYRVLDLHSMAYFHMLRRSIEPPAIKGHSGLDLDAILLYVGLSPESRPHNALTGAKLETEAFSRLIREQPFFKEFEAFPIPWK